MKNQFIMKTKLLYVCLAFIAFTSCDELDELTEVDFNTTITEEVTINFSDQNTTFSETINIDFAGNSDIEPYLDRIEGIQITDASYRLSNYVGTANATGTATVTGAGETFGPFTHDFSADTQSMEEFALTGASKLNALESTLRNTNQLSVSINGAQDPAQNGEVTAIFTFRLTVTAQAL